MNKSLILAKLNHLQVVNGNWGINHYQGVNTEKIKENMYLTLPIEILKISLEKL